MSAVPSNLSYTGHTATVKLSLWSCVQQRNFHNRNSADATNQVILWTRYLAVESIDSFHAFSPALTHYSLTVLGHHWMTNHHWQQSTWCHLSKQWLELHGAFLCVCYLRALYRQQVSVVPGHIWQPSLLMQGDQVKQKFHQCHLLVEVLMWWPCGLMLRVTWKLFHLRLNCTKVFSHIYYLVEH